MKKVLILVLALLLSLSIASVAFASNHNYVAYVSDNSGWVSNGHHGHYWAGDVGGNDRYFDFGTKYSRGYLTSRWFDWDNDGDYYYYLDDYGAAHYFYMDPDRSGDWSTYRDHNGNVQYRYHSNWHTAYIVVR